ncbi:CoA transferase [Myxococcota bacterium]|nr:CoA transferase [Myxococcota bacterium]
MSRPLTGIRVVDATTGIAGAYAGKLLADAGAVVTRVQPEGRDPLDGRLLAQHLHAGKNIGPPDPDADILLVGADDGHSAPVPHLEKRTGTIRVEISPFGNSGPWAGRAATEFTLQAWSGSLEMRELEGRPPVAAGGSPALWASGAMAALGAAAHLGGRGAELEVSIFEVATALWGTPALEPQLAPGMPRPDRAPELPSIEAAADGMVGFGIVTAQQWSDFCRMVERPEWVGDERLTNMAGRFTHRDEVRHGIGAWLTRHTVAEVLEQASLYRIPVVPVGNGETITAIECYRASETFRPNPGAGFLEPRPALRFAPIGAATPAGPEADRDPARPPLSGIRVADFTAFWAGPYAAQLLALLGADVVHIESTSHPDGMRLRSVRSPDRERWWEWSPIFHAVNTSKRSLTLDLEDPLGLEFAQRLISDSDVVMENFSPRVMERWGLDGPGVERLTSDAVVVRMPAFGLEGPWRDRTGFQMTMEQVSGIAWRTGWPDERPICPYVCDAIAGIHAAFGAVCGIQNRRQTGGGQHIELRMCEVAAAIAAEQVVEWSGAGRRMERRGNSAERGIFQDVVRCRDDLWLAVAAETPEQQIRLSEYLASPPSELAAWAIELDSSLCLEALWSLDIPAALVTSAWKIHENPQHQARGFHSLLTHTLAGDLRVPGIPLKPIRGPRPEPESAAPTLGQHNREILMDRLGATREEWERLKNSGVVGETIAGGRSM